MKGVLTAVSVESVCSWSIFSAKVWKEAVVA